MENLCAADSVGIRIKDAITADVNNLFIFFLL
jgi:hypothetical protein